MEAAKHIRGSFVIDGEAVVAGKRGAPISNCCIRANTNKSVMLWAFDLLELYGEDLRQLPLDERKAKLVKPLKGSPRACMLGFEGVVSKRRDGRYVSGRSKTWVKVKNRNAPSVLRFSDQRS